MDSAFPDLRRIRASRLVRGIEHHAEIGSTNNRAAELAALPALDCPVLVLADRQTAGRGRGANRWWSGPKALTFSVVLDAGELRLASERWPQVALAAGVAVAEAIEPLLPAGVVALKWPNDIFLGGKKGGGILVESPAVSTGRLIVGIGLNVNDPFASAPPELQVQGTSMHDASGRRFDRTAVLVAILERLGFWLPTLAEGAESMLAAWRGHCLLTGKRVRLHTGFREVAGICEGIDGSGRLLLLTEQGLESNASGTVIEFE